MGRRVRAVAFPPESRLHADLPRATFYDAFEAELTDAGLAPIDIALRFLRATPAWVEALLGLRNRAVALVGLKSVGRLGAVADRPASTYHIGEPLSFFEVRSIDADELVVGIDDHHLDVRVSFLKRQAGGQATYAVSSWVRTHNRLGQLYMLPVGPIHALIVRQAMRNLEV
jgi:hypothetical protein